MKCQQPLAKATSVMYYYQTTCAWFLTCSETARHYLRTKVDSVIQEQFPTYKLLLIPVFVIILAIMVNAVGQTCTMELPPGSEYWCSYPDYLKDKMCTGGGDESLFWPPTFVDLQQNPITDLGIQQQMHLIECGNGRFVCKLPCQYTDVKCRTRGTYNTLPSGQEDPDRNACLKSPPAKTISPPSFWNRIKAFFIKILQKLYIIQVKTIVINQTIIVNRTI